MQAKDDQEAAEISKSENIDDERTTWTGKRIRGDGKVVDSSGGVGKYLKSSGARTDTDAGGDEYADAPAKKKAKAGGGFGNFDGW